MHRTREEKDENCQSKQVLPILPSVCEIFPSFPHTRCRVPAKESFLFALQTQAWLWALLLSGPLGTELYMDCWFWFVFIFPAHWKQGLFLVKINFGSETLFFWSPALPPPRPSGIFREDSESLLRPYPFTVSSFSFTLTAVKLAVSSTTGRPDKALDKHG